VTTRAFLELVGLRDVADLPPLPSLDHEQLGGMADGFQRRVR
jgi:chromosome segregation and condensation protein ScpB